MRDEKSVLEQLVAWGRASDNVRLMSLTSSRADPTRTPDALSDYDVELYVREAEPFLVDDWVHAFGEVMVRWPATPRPTASPDWVTQLVLFRDGVRIDFQITALSPLACATFQEPYRLLLDKDGVGARLPQPNTAVYHIQPPTAEAFASRQTAFWWDIIYVAKALARRELNYAKTMLDGTIRFEKLLPVLEWYVGARHDWSVTVGVYGRWLERYMEPELWSAYRKTFAAADWEANWEALFAMVEFFRTVSEAVAAAHGFVYPAETDEQVTAYMRQIEAEYR